jgi:hypothetical protein
MNALKLYDSRLVYSDILFTLPEIDEGDKKDPREALKIEVVDIRSIKDIAVLLKLAQLSPLIVHGLSVFQRRQLKALVEDPTDARPINKLLFKMLEGAVMPVKITCKRVTIPLVKLI